MPPRVEHKLTDLGKTLDPIIKSMHDWGEFYKEQKYNIKGTTGCILNPGHGKIPAPDFNFYIQKDKYPI